MADWLTHRPWNATIFPGPAPRPQPAVTDPVAKQCDDPAIYHVLTRSPSRASSSTASTTPILSKAPMDAARGSVSSASTQCTKEDAAHVASPYVLCHGRRYLRDLPYPLPCDLPELQRQNLHTLLTTSVFGRALGSTPSCQKPPAKVLEIACGSAYWSSLCHQHLKALGFDDVSFTGLDVVRLAGDLRKQGMDWTFTQHDLRKMPLPFADGEFDIVAMKDLSLVVPIGPATQRLMDEALRLLKSGGTLEIWETDQVIRSILPHPPPPPSKDADKSDCAVATGTFLISPGTPFVEAQNKYLQDSNAWIQEALDRRKLTATPCARVTQMLLQEPDTLCDVDYRRVAIPLGQLRWERDAAACRLNFARRGSHGAKLAKLGATEGSILTEEQAALRYTALLVVIQMIESLEPLLKEVSGKTQEEWQRWWGLMMADLLEQKGASSGECLEVGVWWAHKV